MTPVKPAKRAAALIVAAALTGAAFGQHQVTDGQFVIDPDSIEAMDLLSRRQREAIHPGSPLEIVGLGQKDNNFRDGLHAAKRGSYVPKMMDERDVYERQIAMYDGSQSFDRPPRAIKALGSEPVDAAPTATQEVEPQKGSYDTTWIGMLLAAAASIGALLTRGRGAPTP